MYVGMAAQVLECHSKCSAVHGVGASETVNVVLQCAGVVDPPLLSALVNNSGAATGVCAASSVATGS